MRGYSNCLFFALALMWRRRHSANRCYIILRKSDWGYFPHAAFAERGHVVAFVPVQGSRRWLPPPLFKGRVRWGDMAEE